MVKTEQYHKEQSFDEGVNHVGFNGQKYQHPTDC